MLKNIGKITLVLSLVVISGFAAAAARAADIVVLPPNQPAGSHEIWMHSEMGQSFVAEATDVKGGFWVEYLPEAAAIMPPNDPITQVFVNLYRGEGIDAANLIHQTSFMVDTTTKGFLDVDYSGAGIKLVPGSMYTIGITSPYNRGWIIPSVCDFQNLDASGQPSGAYTLGHPFFNGQIVIEETGICDNAFHMIDAAAVVTPTPALPTPTFTPTPTPTPTVSITSKKVELKGTVKQVGASSIVVNTTTVYLTPATVIKFNYRGTSLTVGQRVQVKGYKNSDGSVTAIAIEVK